MPVVTITDTDAVFQAIEKWIKQRPQLDPANYGCHPEQLRYSDRQQRIDARRSYRQEVREISKQRRDAMAVLEQARNLHPSKPEILADAFRAFSGRLLWRGENTCYSCDYSGPCTTCPNCVKPTTEPHLEYTAGQYFPTEYRKAAEVVLHTYVADWLQDYHRTNPRIYTFRTVADVKEANRATGQHYFDRGTVRFFRSKVASKLYKGRYFVTSEQFDDRSPRLYTIREAQPDASIDTVGEFQQYSSVFDAIAAIKELS